MPETARLTGWRGEWQDPDRSGSRRGSLQVSETAENAEDGLGRGVEASALVQDLGADEQGDGELMRASCLPACMEGIGGESVGL